MLAIGGVSGKSLAAGAGSFAGLAFAAAAGWIFLTSSGLGGFFMEEVRLLNYYNDYGPFFFVGLLTAIIIFGAAGVVMDTSVSVSSTMAELRRYRPGISSADLQKAGEGVGRELRVTSYELRIKREENCLD